MLPVTKRSHPYCPADHKLFLFTWYIYRDVSSTFSGFLLLTSENKRRRYAFNLLFFLVINIYCFLNDHDAWILLFEYFLWFVQVSAVFESLFKCYFAVPISLPRKFRKKTHTDTRLFFFEKPWAKFFLKPFVFAIQFWNKSWILFFANSPCLKKFVEFYFAKTNSAKIYIFLSIYSVKIYSFTVIYVIHKIL